MYQLDAIGQAKNSQTRCLPGRWRSSKSNGGGLEHMQNNRLRYLREKEALTQTNIANALHIGQSTYNRYERGVREPDHETLKKIADYFHVSLDFLLKHDRPYTRKEPGIDLASFLMEGSYKIFSRTPTQKDRKKLVNLLNALYGEDPRQ